MFHLEDGDQACTGFPDDDDIIVHGHQTSDSQTDHLNKVFQPENSNQSCFDLYSDFLTHDHQQQQESSQELKEKLSSAEEKIVHLQGQLEKVVSVAETLTVENKTLLHNLSLLHATARLELKRKDTSIQLLRKRLSGHWSYTKTSSLITSRRARNSTLDTHSTASPQRNHEIHEGMHRSVVAKEFCETTDNIRQSDNAHTSPRKDQTSKLIDGKESKLRDCSPRDIAHSSASRRANAKDHRSRSRDRDFARTDSTDDRNSPRSHGDHKSNHSPLANSHRTESPHRHATIINKSSGDSSLQRSHSQNERLAISRRGDQTCDSSKRHALDRSLSYPNSSKCFRLKIDISQSRRSKKVSSTHVDSKRDQIKSRSGSHDSIRKTKDSPNKNIKGCSYPIELSEDSESLRRSRRESHKPISVISSRRASLSTGGMKRSSSNPNELSKASISAPVSDRDIPDHGARRDSHDLSARRDSPSDGPRRDRLSDKAIMDGPSNRVRKKSPSDRAWMDSPSDKPISDIPNDRTKMDSSSDRTRTASSSDRAIGDSPSDSEKKDSPSDRTRRDRSSGKARKDSPSRKPKKDSPNDRAGSERHGHRARKDSHSDPAIRVSPNDTARKDSPSDTTIRDSPSDTTIRDSPSDTARKDSPSDRPRMDSSSDTTIRNSPSNTAIRDSLSDRARKDSPIDVTKKDSPNDRARKDSPSDMARKDSPSDMAKKDSPSHRARGDVPNNKGRRDSPCPRARGDSPDHKTRRNSSCHEARIESPGHMARRDSPCHRARRDNPGHTARRESSGHRERMDSPGHRERMNSPGHMAGESPGQGARKDSPSHGARRHSPGYRARESPGHGARRDSPGHRARRDSPGHRARESPGHKVRRESPGHKARRDSLGHMARRDSPGHRERRDSPVHTAKRESPGHEARRESLSQEARRDSSFHRERKDSPSQGQKSDTHGHRARRDSPSQHARMDSPGNMARKGSPDHKARIDSPKPITSKRASSEHRTIRDRLDHGSSREPRPTYLSSRRDSPSVDRSRNESPNNISSGKDSHVSRHYSRSPARLKEGNPIHISRHESNNKDRSPKEIQDKIESQKGSPDKHILRKEGHKNNSINDRRSMEKNPSYNRSRSSNDTKLCNPAQIKSRNHSQGDERSKTIEHKSVSLDKSRQSRPKSDILASKTSSASSHEHKTRDGEKIIVLKSRRDNELSIKHKEHRERRPEHQSRSSSHTKHESRSSDQLASSTVHVSSNERTNATDDRNKHETKKKNISDLRQKLERSRMKAKAQSHSNARRHSSADQENRSSSGHKLKSRNSEEENESLNKKHTVHLKKLATDTLSKTNEASVKKSQGHKRKASVELITQSPKRTHFDVEIADADTSEANDVIDKTDQSETVLPIDDVEATEVTSTAVVSTPDSSMFFEDSMDSSSGGLNSLLATKRDILESLNKSFSSQLSDTSDRIMDANISINSPKPVILSDNGRKCVISPDNSISSSDVRTVIVESKDEHFMPSIADREASRDSIFECDVLCYTEEDMDEADRLCMSETQYSDECEQLNSSDTPHIAPNCIGFEEGEISSESWMNDDSANRRIVHSNRGTRKVVRERQRRMSGHQSEERRHISERRDKSTRPHHDTDKQRENTHRSHKTERRH